METPFSERVAAPANGCDAQFEYFDMEKLEGPLTAWCRADHLCGPCKRLETLRLETHNLVTAVAAVLKWSDDHAYDMEDPFVKLARAAGLPNVYQTAEERDADMEGTG